MSPTDYFTYAGENARNVVFPLGGIGAGCIGLGGDGRLRDWEIFNRPSKGSVNGFSHFAIRAEQDGKVLDTRLLHGPFQGSLMGDPLGRRFNSFGFGVQREHMAGFPSFAACTLSGPYPVASLEFADPRFPGQVKYDALSPFLPMESRLSSLPTAMFDFAVTNTTDKAIDYTLFGCLAFDLGHPVEVTADSRPGRTIIAGRTAIDPADTAYSEIAIASDADATSVQRHFFRGTWFDAVEIYWRDITAGGPLKDRFYPQQAAGRMTAGWKMPEHSLLACHVSIPAGQTRNIRAAISWFVPNVTKTWVSQSELLEAPRDVSKQWKNYYATQWDSAANVSDATFGQWDELVGGTRTFRDCIVAATLPDPVKDAVSANLSILKTATVLRLEDGTFYGWEGCHPNAGSCEGSCTHVWNYQQSLAFLFPDLERSMREADFAHNQIAETGGMAFRLSLPLGIGTANDRPCVDGQFGNVLKTFRDWKLSGDLGWLARMWPHVKAAIEYAWHPGNYDRWDPNQTGTVTGRQHHTLDMELFGPSSWLNGFYLGALVAGATMAEALGETETAVKYRAIFARGRAWMKTNLFNGAWFVQAIDLQDRNQLQVFERRGLESNFIKGSIFDLYWSEEYGELKYQIGDGCEIDQVIAQWHGRLYGLEDVFDADQFATAVRSIYQHNFRARLGDVPNPCRVFGLEDEAGTQICTWPASVRRPAIPVPYSQETMHGFEYAFGCQLMMIGEVEKGTEVFAAVRDRYRGHNRNPWNEMECGSNYARSMSSYAAVPVLAGFSFDLSRGLIGFDPQIQRDGLFRAIWSAGSGWGK